MTLGLWSYHRCRLAVRPDTLPTSENWTRFPCAIYIYIITRARFLPCIHYGSHKASVSFCCLTIICSILVKKQNDTDAIWLVMWTCSYFCCLSNIDIHVFQYVPQNSTCTKQNMIYPIILAMMPMYSSASEVQVCIKTTLKGEFSSSPSCSVGRAFGYKS